MQGTGNEHRGTRPKIGEVMGQLMPIISTGLQIFGMVSGGKGGDAPTEEPKVEEKNSLLFSPRKSKSAAGTLISGVR